MGVRVENSYVAFLADVFGCKIGVLPCKYLGLSLCLGVPKKHLWELVVERIEKKLSSWKGRYLSMGGRLTLIKSVLPVVTSAGNVDFNNWKRIMHGYAWL